MLLCLHCASFVASDAFHPAHFPVFFGLMLISPPPRILPWSTLEPAKNKKQRDSEQPDASVLVPGPRGGGRGGKKQVVRILGRRKKLVPLASLLTTFTRSGPGPRNKHPGPKYCHPGRPRPPPVKKISRARRSCPKWRRARRKGGPGPTPAPPVPCRSTPPSPCGGPARRPKAAAAPARPGAAAGPIAGPARATRPGRRRPAQARRAE